MDKLESNLRAIIELAATLEAAGADADEGDAVAVLRVRVGLGLEHEAGELGFVGFHLAALGGRARRCGDPGPVLLERAPPLLPGCERWRPC